MNETDLKLENAMSSFFQEATERALGATLEQAAALHACIQAIKFPGSLCRVTFKSADQVDPTLHAIQAVLLKRGLLDEKKTLEQHEHPTIEMTNGSGIELRLEPKPLVEAIRAARTKR
jgi:hypothetical protein